MIPNDWQPSDPDAARLRDRMLAGFGAVATRMDALETRVTAWENSQSRARTEHRTRTWQVVLAVVSGLVLPLATIGIVALLHLTGM